jgi:hypothetical protein
MKREEINSFIKMINHTLLEPLNYPKVVSDQGVRGFIQPKVDDYWMSSITFSETIGHLSKNNDSAFLIAAEDFERTYKSTEVTVRLNDLIPNSWNNFLSFITKNEMISFFVFDETLSWCAWFNDEYWCLVCQTNSYNSLHEKYINFENTLKLFPDSDDEFKVFMQNIYLS